MDEIKTDVALQITDKIRIVNGDNDCFVLQTGSMSEKSNTLQWRNKGYYKDVLSCLYAVLQKMPIEQGDTLETYITRFEKLYEYLYIDTIGKTMKEVIRHETK